MKNSVNDCYLLVWEFPSFSMIFFDKLASYVKFLGNKKQMTIISSKTAIFDAKI